MAGYARLLRIHAYVDLYYCVVNFSTSVEPVSYRGYFYLVPTGFLRHINNRYWWAFFLGTFYHTVLIEMLITPVDFYYRYITVCRNRTMTNKTLYGVVTFLLLLSLFVSIPVYWAVGPVGPSHRTPLEANITLTLYEIERFADLDTIFAYNPTSGFTAYFNHIVLQCTFFIGFLAVTWSYVSIRRKLKEHSKANPKSKLHHLEHQINRIMLLQLLVPVFAIGLAVAVTATAAVVQYDLPQMGAVYRVTCKWVSALKPLITMFLISAYRNGLARRISAKKRCPKSRYIVRHDDGKIMPLPEREGHI
ncbi:unnamed protein product [Bursaphelenchus xylophilus]|uniref:(pine wood nematode) hypothetical protein n=1 Tax=Bursaphelenchus xylophilus TaxID=6326 RepID=A0A1I7RMG7_BURXY|nr:unnamed protein product [Bursaphelenchus xylophilus]CAG9118474.1 unnamed protein product [Bursaphelenchus xylophilus]